MPSLQSIKASIEKESVAGTPITPVAVLPIKGLPSLDRTIEKQADPVIVGAGMAAGEFPVAASVKGSISLSPRACAGYGKCLKGAFGAEAAPAEILAVIRIKYTGASASCKITTDISGKTINSKIGALGSEANDTTFYASTGSIPLTNASYDTPAELVAYIDGLADYEAKLITGSGASTITSVVTGIFQAKGKWAILVLTGTGSGAYVHRFTPDLAIANERPTLTVQLDLGTDNLRYAGVSVNSLSHSAALKGLLECEVELIGFTEQAGQSAMSALTLPDAKNFIFGGGVSSISGADYTYVRSMSAKAENALKDDGYGQSSLDRAYHAKGLFGFSGDLKLRLDATSYLERAKVASGVVASELFIFYAAESKCVGTSAVAELLIIEVPYSEHSGFSFEDNGGIIDCSLTWKGFNPGGSYNYDSPVVVTLISADSAAY